MPTGYFQVTSEEVAQATGIDSTVVRDFLDFFTTGFGQTDLGNGWPSVYEPFDRAPFLRLSNDLWLIHLGANSIFRFRAAIEEAIKRDQGLWRRYERHRSAYLERHAINMIKSTSPHANGWVHLEYTFGEGDGARNFDLDGLVLVDQTAFLVEAKAGAMTPAARRGSRSAIDQIKRLFDEAQQQTERAARYIRSSKEVRFRSSKGPIRIRSGDISRIYLISVTLDSLHAFTANKSWLSRSGIVKSGESAWSVCDLDLEVVTELVTGVGEFASFLDFRSTVHEVERVIVVDELDWFGLFLFSGAQPVRKLGPMAWGGVLFADFAMEIEDYYHSNYYRKMVLRSPSPKPRQRMPSTIALLIETLERNGPPGFIDAVVILLQMTRRERKSISKSIDQLWLLEKENKNLAFRVKLGSGSVLCYSRTRNLFKGYARAAKYSLRADWAVCILQTTRRGAVVHSERYPWREDASLEEFSRNFLMQVKSRRELLQI